MTIELLVVDDDIQSLNLMEIYLQSAGYIVHKASNARDGLALLTDHACKLAVIDTMMPEIDGIEMCRRVRERYNIPILLLSGRNPDSNVLDGFNAGADDYLIKPFNPLEFTARVRALLRRYMELNPNSKRQENLEIHIGPLYLNARSHYVAVDGKPVALTPMEFDILALLASDPNKVFSPDDIFEQVWGEKIYETNNTVITHIRKMRDKIEKDPKHPKIILTVWGIGYKISQP